MLPRAARQALQRELDEAACAIDNGHLAWQRGAFGPENIAGIIKAQTTLANRIAEFEDKREPKLCTDSMRAYEQMAADLLEGIAALNAPDRIEDSVRSPTGSWIMSRRFLLDNRQHEHAVVCNNPAVCRRELDQWEAAVRAAAPLMRDAA